MKTVITFHKITSVFTGQLALQHFHQMFKKSHPDWIAILAIVVSLLSLLFVSLIIFKLMQE